MVIARQQRSRDLLVVALTLTTGAVDAVCFLHLGRVFGSVITGNLVLAGVAAGTGVAALAAHAGVALAGYVAGVSAGAPIARERDRERDSSQLAWPARVTGCLAAEVIVLCVFSTAWWLADGRPHGTIQFVLLGLAAAAMGMQSAAVRRLGAMSSTYLTSTLTGILAGLMLRDVPEGLARSLAVLGAIVAGALAGAITASHVPRALPAVVLIPVVLVIASALSLRRHPDGDR
jgi:uncharacterized membrane protein YoaK (UPF0700 family)